MVFTDIIFKFLRDIFKNVNNINGIGFVDS